MTRTQWRLYLDQIPIFKKTALLLYRGIRQKMSKKAVRLDPAGIGRSHRGKTISITPGKIELFSKTIGETAPFSPTSPHGRVTSPMFSIIPAMYSLLNVFSDKKVGVDFSSLMVVGQQTEFMRLARAGERVYSQSTVKDVVEKKSGQWLHIQSDGFNDQGEKLFQDNSSFYIRDQKKFFTGIKEIRKLDLVWTLPPNEKVTLLKDCRIPKGQIAHYSKVTGDYNPFHYLSAIARHFGYDDKFVPGTCVASLLTKLIIEGVLEGNPHGLKRISLLLWEKVREGDLLKTKIWDLKDQKGGPPPAEVLWQDSQNPLDPDLSLLAFQVTNQEGSLVIPRGVAAVRRSPRSRAET